MTDPIRSKDPVVGVLNAVSPCSSCSDVFPGLSEGSMTGCVSFVCSVSLCVIVCMCVCVYVWVYNSPKNRRDCDEVPQSTIVNSPRQTVANTILTLRDVLESRQIE